MTDYVETHKVSTSIRGGFHILLHKTFLEQDHSARLSCTADTWPLNEFEKGPNLAENRVEYVLLTTWDGNSIFFWSRGLAARWVEIKLCKDFQETSCLPDSKLLASPLLTVAHLGMLLEHHLTIAQLAEHLTVVDEQISECPWFDSEWWDTSCANTIAFASIAQLVRARA